MSDLPPVGAPTAPEERTRERGRLATWARQPKTVTGAVIIALTAWFILANTAETRIHFWVVWVTVTLWVGFLVAFGAGVAFGLVLRRRGERRRRRERERERR
jgi:uncharacterized membrane protein YbhN (UPF0104 family)